MSDIVILEGALRKAYEEFILGKGSLSEEQIAKLKTVTQLPNDFLNGCVDERFQKITSIDLSMFVSVVEIGHGFLSKCSALTSVDLSALTSLWIIGNQLLNYCSALTSVTLPSTSQIMQIKSFFLAGCSSLTTINNMQALSNVKCVAMCFLLNCPKLTKKEHLDQVNLTPVLHLSDNHIEAVEYYEGNNNLKTALARVRAGGANGPKLAGSSSSPTAASQSSNSPCGEERIVGKNCRNQTEEHEEAHRQLKNTVPGSGRRKAPIASLDDKWALKTFIADQTNFRQSAKSVLDIIEEEHKNSVAELEEAQKREREANDRARAAEEQLVQKQEEILQLQNKLLVKAGKMICEKKKKV